MKVTREQAGVVSREQLHENGFTDDAIAGLLRRRELSRVYAGVFVDHTGPLTWDQRAWAALLSYWPAALAGASALHAWRMRGYEPEPDAPIEIVVDRSRSVRRRPGICVRQLVRYETYCRLDLDPPRERLEHALLRVASARSGLDASIAELADAVQSGRTAPPRLVAALEERPRLRHRRVLLDVVTDVASGARSVLEHRYLTRVERAHGLPTGQRQVRFRTAAGTDHRDVDYTPYGVVVELDGARHRESAAARWADFDRDLRALVGGDVTVRVGWRQVIDECRLAIAMGNLFQARGWEGQVLPCSPNCATNSAPGAEDVAQR